MPRNYQMIENVEYSLGKKQFRSLETKGNNKFYEKDEIIKLGQDEADKLKAGNHDALIGIAYHFKGINQWVGGKMNSVNDPFEIFDVSYNDAYADDDIDSICIIVVKKEGNEVLKALKPKGDKPREKKINASVFKKKK